MTPHRGCLRVLMVRNIRRSRLWQYSLAYLAEEDEVLCTTRCPSLFWFPEGPEGLTYRFGP